MKTLLILLLSLFVVQGCSLSRQQSADRFATTSPNQSLAGLNQMPSAEATKASYAYDAVDANLALERKIIRKAELSLVVENTIDAQHKVTSIAEARGGFVVNSEAKQRENIDPAKRLTDIKLVLRVPANEFGPALDAIKGLASNLPEENVTGEDVTEEFIDLEARLRTQKALELQFLEIMKQAKKVEDALEVQRQIADVRTEIEKLEGRKRFLENRSSLSTITVNLKAPTPIVVSTTGFGHSIREAASESVDLASGMVMFFIRSVIVMIPIFAFVLLPLGLLLRYLMRRAKRIRLAQTLATPTAEA